MAVTFAVQGDDEGEVRAALTRLCDALSLEPLGRPMQGPGRARWLARAVPETAEGYAPVPTLSGEQPGA
ncbi:hypothetical protein PV350_35345 [Streptomyces sp. PA03-6a]|nr:hypothetical protein [Streptomyces sp. PA03-6a]